MKVESCLNHTINLGTISLCLCALLGVTFLGGKRHSLLPRFVVKSAIFESF